MSEQDNDFTKATRQELEETARDLDAFNDRLLAQVASLTAENKRLVGALKTLESAWDTNRDVPYHCWEALHKLLATTQKPTDSAS